MTFQPGPSTWLRKIQKNTNDTSIIANRLNKQYLSEEAFIRWEICVKSNNPPHWPYLCQFFIKSDVVTCVGLLQVSSIHWSKGSIVWRRGSWRRTWSYKCWCHEPRRVVSHVTPITLLWHILDPYRVTLWKSLSWLPPNMYIIPMLRKLTFLS